MGTVFESEIRSQGQVLAARSAPGLAQAKAVAASWRDSAYALVAARGSSDNAARFFQYLAGQELGLLVALAAPSLYEGERVIGLAGAAVLAVSQSGRSPGMTDVVAQARAQGRPTAAVTNDLTSPLAAGCDHVIDLATGPERAIASSKTFAATWQALAQLVSALRETELDGLDALAEDVDHVAAWALGASLPLELLDGGGGLTVVGRGVGFAAAAEVALKIREVAGVRAEVFAASDYVHGPIGADGEGSTLVFVVTDETSDELAATVLADCRGRGMTTVVVRGADRGSVAADDEIVIPLARPNWVLGLGAVVVGQVAALRLGERRGRPIDTSPGLSKVTYSA
ncbi:MAG: SIS domain-containing protein [Acidimicrobiales bacterium]